MLSGPSGDPYLLSQGTNLRDPRCLGPRVSTDCAEGCCDPAVGCTMYPEARPCSISTFDDGAC